MSKLKGKVKIKAWMYIYGGESSPTIIWKKPTKKMEKEAKAWNIKVVKVLITQL